ncbi:hypothetical protein [Hymenobacter sp. BT730]|uniref:hypothetical protein n=1 Tax=Hymenobacter sp. BT730 TaxID=3063332 RepID=UPI0026DEC44E|nr:hypothetical protein [Hymenobacter sp. BT730]
MVTPEPRQGPHAVHHPGHGLEFPAVLYFVHDPDSLVIAGPELIGMVHHAEVISSVVGVDGPVLLDSVAFREVCLAFVRPHGPGSAHSVRRNVTGEDALGITQPELLQQILSEPRLVDELFKFMYKLKTEKVKADRNPGGLFLKMQGLR